MRLIAYLDPGSASAAMAAILAAIAGAGAGVRTYGKKAKDKVFFWKKKEPELDAPAATPSVSAPSTPDTPAAPAPDSGDDKPAGL